MNVGGKHPLTSKAVATGNARNVGPTKALSHADEAQSAEAGRLTGRLTRFRPGVNLLRGAALAFAPAILYFFTLWSPLPWLTALWCAVLMGAAVQEARQIRKQLRALVVRRTHPSVAGRALAFSVTWEVSTAEPSVMRGELRDVVPPDALPRLVTQSFAFDGVTPKVSLSQRYRIAKRGRHSFGSVWMRIIGPRRLVEAQREFGVATTIRIMPEKFVSREEFLQDEGAAPLLLDSRTKSREQGAGTEFESLLEFRDGDDPRRIDWRATARRGHMIVRRFQIERHRDVMLLVDCGRLMGTDALRGTKLDCAIDGALILARTALQGGDRCGLALFDDRLRGYLPPISGVAALQSLTDVAFDAQSEFREMDFGVVFAELQMRQTKRSLIVVLSDIADTETSGQFQASLARLGKRHVVLFVALRTPSIERMIGEPVNAMLDAARKAVAFRLLRERRETIQALRKSGVFVLDVEPAKLTVPLINYYLDLRARNLL
ncbi:MAG: hypothetical protein C0483_17360 [Pirellula sp.]|nr:hypothetical protein [Pirellula sp.]